MNITSVSFCGHNNQSKYTYRNTESQRYVDELRREAGFDSYQSSAESTVINTNRKQHHPFNPYKALCLAGATLKMLSLLHSCATQPPSVVDVNAKAGESISDYALVYNIDEDAIKDYNNLSSSVLGSDTVISIPSTFNHPIGDEIAEYTFDLYSKDLAEEEQAELVSDIEELRKIQQLQSEIATMYTDGNYAYFLITLPTDQTATETQAGYGGHINVEQFKEIFGIKDGAIKDHNNIDYTWGGNEHGSYMDYTIATLYNGQTIKVPVSAVNLKYISELND